ncbi:hypothetical protein ACLK1W_03610 [Escherichia coli]
MIHWVSATHSLPAEIRLYDRLFSCRTRVPRMTSKGHSIRIRW